MTTTRYAEKSGLKLANSGLAISGAVTTVVSKRPVSSSIFFNTGVVDRQSWLFWPSSSMTGSTLPAGCHCEQRRWIASKVFHRATVSFIVASGSAKAYSALPPPISTN